MITAWRIISANNKDKAFTGDGARTHGGRWSSKGVAVIYTADSLALASIEMIVNLPAPKLLQNRNGFSFLKENWTGSTGSSG